MRKSKYRLIPRRPGIGKRANAASPPTSTHTKVGKPPILRVPLKKIQHAGIDDAKNVEENIAAGGASPYCRVIRGLCGDFLRKLYGIGRQRNGAGRACNGESRAFSLATESQLVVSTIWVQTCRALFG